MATFYSFAKSVVYSVFKPLYRMEVVGAEDFPKEGGVLLCANHIHNFDPLVVGINAPRPVHYMAKEEIFKVPVLGTIVRKCNAFPVKRGKGDRESLRTGMKILKDGHVFGLFPEGTRSKNGEIRKRTCRSRIFCFKI